MKYSNVDLSDSLDNGLPQRFWFRVASGTSGGNVEIRADNQSTGPLLGTCGIPSTGGWNTWQTIGCDISSNTLLGKHDLYLNFAGGSGYLFDMHWFAFGSQETPPQVEASTFSQVNNILVNQSCTDAPGAVCINYIQNGSWAKYSNANLTNIPQSVLFRVASGTSGGTIQIRADNQTSGSILGTCNIPGTGGWNTWQTVSCVINSKALSGAHDLYLNISGGSGYLFDLHWFAFAVPTPSSVIAASTFSQENSVQINPLCTDGIGVTCVNYIQNGSWLKYSSVDLTGGNSSSVPKVFWFRITSGGSGGTIQIRVDNQASGPVIGTCQLPGTGNWNSWQTLSCAVSSNTITGTHDLYLNISGGSGYLFDLHWFAFSGGN